MKKLSNLEEKDRRGLPWFDEIVCGECSELMKQLPDNCIDLVVTSPPYDNVDEEMVTHSGKGLRDYQGYEWDFVSVADELWRVIKTGGVVVWVVGDATKDFCESLASARQKIYFVDKCGFNLLDTMIYEKNGYPSQYPGMMRYMGAYEYMLILTKGKPNFFNPIEDRPTLTKGESRNSFTQRQKNGSTMRTRSGFKIGKFSKRNNVWRYNTGHLKVTKDKFTYTHPAIFPEALARDHIISWSNPGAIVLDPFCGSGTTPKMAIETDRHYLGFEISQEYTDLAKKRIKSARVPLPGINL